MKKLFYCILLASLANCAMANDADDDLDFLPTNPNGKIEKNNIQNSTVLNMEQNNVQPVETKNQPTQLEVQAKQTEITSTTPPITDNSVPSSTPTEQTYEKQQTRPSSPRKTSDNKTTSFGNGKYNYVAKLPVSEIYVVQKTSKSAKLYFADSQGRYLIYNGDLYDMWDNRRKLDNKVALEYSFTHIPLDVVKKFQGLNEIVSIPKERSILKGREFYLFIDPTDENSIKMLENIYNDRNFISYYTHIVIMNNTTTALTKEFIKKLSCSDATAREKIESIINRDTDILDKTQTFCNISQIEEKLNNNDKLAKYINIQNLPFLIAPSGRYTDGALIDPYKFIQGIK